MLSAAITKQNLLKLAYPVRRFLISHNTKSPVRRFLISHNTNSTDKTVGILVLLLQLCPWVCLVFYIDIPYTHTGWSLTEAEALFFPSAMVWMFMSYLQIHGVFPGSSAGTESACNAGDPSSTPGSGKSTAEGVGYPFSILGLPWWLSWKRIHLQCRRPGFDPWVGKIPRRRKWLPTPVCWSGEFHGLATWGCKELDTTERLSLSRSLKS